MTGYNFLSSTNHIYEFMMANVEEDDDYWIKRENYARIHDLLPINLDSYHKSNYKSFKGDPSVKFYKNLESPSGQYSDKYNEIAYRWYSSKTAESFLEYKQNKQNKQIINSVEVEKSSFFNFGFSHKRRGPSLSQPYQKSEAETYDLNSVKKNNAEKDSINADYKVVGNNKPNHGFYALASLNEAKNSTPYTFDSVEQHKAGLSVETLNKMEVIKGQYFPIPSPIYHRLDSLLIEDENGEILRHGEDYIIHVSKDKTHYLLKMKNALPDSKIKFNAHFSPITELIVDAKRWDMVSANDALRIAKLMNSAGMNRLAAKIISHVKKLSKKEQNISIHPILKLIQNQSIYAQAPLKASELADEVNNNPFSKYRKFIGMNTICAQCTGSSEIFSEFLNLINADTPQFFARRIEGGVVGKNNNIVFHPGHAITQIEWDGQAIAHMDPTAMRKDPRYSIIKKMMNLNTSNIKRQYPIQDIKNKVLKTGFIEGKSSVDLEQIDETIVDEKKMEIDLDHPVCDEKNCSPAEYKEDPWIKQYVSEFKDKRSNLLRSFKPNRNDLRNENLKGRSPLKKLLHLLAINDNFLSGALRKEQVIFLLQKEFPNTKLNKRMNHIQITGLVNDASLEIEKTVKKFVLLQEKGVRNNSGMKSTFNHYISGETLLTFNDSLEYLRRPFYTLSEERLGQHLKFQHSQNQIACMKSSLIKVLLGMDN